MKSPVLLLATTAAFFPAYAFQLPFKLPFNLFSSDSQTPLIALPEVPETQTIPNRVAIIGAGAAGSSAAFWVAKAKERYGLDVEIDVYDKNTYIGGRSTTVHPYDDPTLEPHELGASIFIKANKNMWRAVDEFGLERVGFSGEDEDDVMGIWDGHEFVLTTGGGGFYSDWLDKIKILWRYGYKAPTKTQALVKSMIDKFVTLYEPSPPRWSNITSVANDLEWLEITAQTTAEYLDSQGIDRRFSRELVEAATRVNYGHDVDKIHALEGMCSLAPTGASSVKGGNWQIFEHFIAQSGARVFLNTTVKSVTKLSSKVPWIIQTASSSEGRLYRAVIIAAPYHQTGLKVTTGSSDLAATVPEQPYVHLHVTLLSTSARTPNASYFNLPPHAEAPTTVLTTHDGVRLRGRPEPEFNSLTYHGHVLTKEGEKRLTETGEEEWVVKIFSKARLDDEWLRGVFGGKVGWVLRKEWDAYPVLPPTTEFPPVKLAEGLYYVNAFEPLISTMETETIAARNVVELLLKEEYGAGLCKPGTTEDEVGASSPREHDFVYGWDC
ncbi:FAD/NAD(P)-binding domain-containing protein [Dichomitus squalens]|uniref:FAD/NAD(P)-binding domain-containing protein n=1 Tax=Dichomitus squalens TaxID=114155 RepID=A0A4Q9MKT1_9APHY|nr:FAD/NAD(P)-binding domain-containing protein [Dichomitus squalens]